MTTTPILSPRVAGLWMQIPPKALWARFVAWVGTPENKPRQEGAEEPSESFFEGSSDPSGSVFLSDEAASWLANEYLNELERQGVKLTDEGRVAVLRHKLDSLPWA